MTIRPRTPSLFRPPIDQRVLTENRKLVADIDRRGLLRGAVSLGALTMLTGCDVSEIDSVQKGLRAVSSCDLPHQSSGADIQCGTGDEAAAL